VTERRVVVTSDHEIPDRPAITIEPGDRVDVGERSDEWPAFVLVTATGGAGWVPERYLDAGRPTATVLEPYDTQELAASAGDELTLVVDDPESEWAWCRDAGGRTGWVPHRALDPGRSAPA
jgi:SH3-like domain-containing protein